MDSRAEFESIAGASGFHDFEVSGNGCYCDNFLQHFYAGWQASRQARVAELYSALDNANERLADGCQLSGDEIDDVDAALLNTGCEAFILRKQAEAVDKLQSELASDYPEKPYIRSMLQSMGVRADSLRNDADKAGGDV